MIWNSGFKLCSGSVGKGFGMVKAMSMIGTRTQFVKKMCLLLLAVIMAAGLMIALGVVTAQKAYAEPEVTSDGVRYIVYDTGDEAKVIGYTDDLPETVTIPDRVQYNGVGHTVRVIGGSAFEESVLTGITIPALVRSIDGGAFSNCSNLRTVTFAENSSLKKIDTNAFDLCKSLKSITIPESVTSIGAYAFQGSGLTSITIPAGVKIIANNTFKGCSDLETIIFADDSSLNIIQPDAFNNTGLKSITIPAGVTSIGKSAFYKCSNLETVTFESVRNLVSIGEWAFYKTGFTSITIPTTVTNIGKSAFEGSKLTSIMIPASVTIIGEKAFNECNSLNTVYYCGTEEQWNNMSGRHPNWAGGQNINVVFLILGAPEGKTLPYNGKEQTGVEAVTGYTLSGKFSETEVGSYQATATLDEHFQWADGTTDPKTINWSIEQAQPVIETNPTASAITYGQTLADSILSDGIAKAGDAVVPGTFTWANDTIKPAVSDSGKTEYEVTFTPNDTKNYKTVTTKITLTVNSPAPSATSIDNAPVVLDLAPLTFTGQPITPIIQTIGGKELQEGKDYTITYSQNGTPIEAPTEAGTYTMTITGKGDFAGSTSMEFTISKSAGTLKATGNKVKAKSKTVRLKKTRKISAEKAYSIEGSIGELTYTKVKVNKKAKKFKVNATTGQINVKKGLKKGKYELTVLVSDSGDKNHEAAEAEAVVTIKVKK